MAAISAAAPMIEIVLDMSPPKIPTVDRAFGLGGAI
jgi:hypothetical protein